MAMSCLHLEFSPEDEYSTQTTMKKAKQLLLQKLISRLDEDGADLPHPPTKE